MNDKDTDKRLRRVYGITLAEYNAMLAKQDGGCCICGSPPKTRRLHTDHDHSWKKVKITILEKVGLIYPAKAEYKGREYLVGAPSKQEARHVMREILKRDSVRGILCFPCNRGIRVFFDNPVRLRAAADYLERFNGKTS